MTWVSDEKLVKPLLIEFGAFSIFVCILIATNSCMERVTWARDNLIKVNSGERLAHCNQRFPTCFVKENRKPHIIRLMWIIVSAAAPTGTHKKKGSILFCQPDDEETMSTTRKQLPSEQEEVSEGSAILMSSTRDYHLHAWPLQAIRKTICIAPA